MNTWSGTERIFTLIWGLVHKTFTRPIYIGKNQNPKKIVFFVVPFTLPEKPITFRVFGKKSACAKKPESHTVFLVRMRDFSLPLTVRSAHYAAAGCGWFLRRRSRPAWPKTRIIPVRWEWAFTLAKNQWKTGGVSKNHTSEVGFFIQVFCSV